MAGAIGAFCGCAAGLAVGKLSGFQSFWLGLALVGGGTWLGGLLAQKIASK